MILRKIVPVLSALAATGLASAADEKNSLVFSGWSDNILYAADDGFTKNDPTTAKDEAQPTVFFNANASLKADWTVEGRVHARVNLWVINNVSGSSASSLNMREAYAHLDLDGGFSLTMGKFIDHIGWIAPEPTGLYRINASNIGYTAFFYGNDVVGANLAFAKKDSPFSGSFHVTNGYFTGADASNPGIGFGGTAASRTGGRENYDLGYGLDLIYALGSKGSSVNLEFADDPHSGGTAATAGAKGGNVFQAGLNATFKDVDGLTVGAEVIYRDTGTAVGPDGVTKITGTDQQDIGYMLLANYGLKGMPFPSSITGSFQQYTTNFNAPGSVDTTFTDFALALLTNPLVKSPNFGANLELSYITASGAGAPSGANNGTDEAFIASLELLVVIP